MTELAATGYEGTPGAAVPADIWDNTFSGTWAYTTTGVATGATAAKITGQGVGRKTLSPTLSGVRLRGYYTVPIIAPGTNVTIIPFRTGTTALAGLRHEAAGTLALLNVNTISGSPSAPLVAGQTCRVEWAAKTDGTTLCELWRGGNMHSTGNPDETLTGAWTAAAGDNIGACWPTLVAGFESIWDDVVITDTPTVRIGPSLVLPTGSWTRSHRRQIGA